MKNSWSAAILLAAGAFPNTRPAVTINRRRIHFQSQWIFHDWAWTGDAKAVRTAAWTYSASQQPMVMYSRGLTEYEQTIIDVFSAVANGAYMTQ